MPKVTVYIRNEDMPLWKKIEKKSAFISSVLYHLALRSNSSESNPYTHAAAKEAMADLGMVEPTLNQWGIK